MIYQVRYKNKIRGFTLIELLIVVSVIAIFSSISVVAYKNINERSIFNGAVNTITGAIPYAKNKALNQSLNNNWGVYLQNDSVTIFSGDNYLSRNATYDEVFKLPNGITISGLTEIVFDKITGKIENEGDIVISRKEDQRTIHVNYYGVVFYNKDAGETNICQDTNAINYGGILPCQYEGASPSGTISSSPSSCLITSGNNSCSSSLSWSTTNPINTSIVSKSGSTIATGNSGTQSVSISYGTNTFDLINDGKTLNSVSVTGSCDSGLNWNGSLCEVEVFVPTFNYALDMNNDWGSGYCTNVTITTNSPDPVVWEVNIPLTTPPQSGTPNSTWNLTWSFSNQILKISGIAEWNYYVSSSSPNTTGGFCATR